jgi:hypothetical protein
LLLVLFGFSVILEKEEIAYNEKGANEYPVKVYGRWLPKLMRHLHHLPFERIPAVKG